MFLPSQKNFGKYLNSHYEIIQITLKKDTLEPVTRLAQSLLRECVNLHNMIKCHKVVAVASMTSHFCMH